jgi:hypothetical protein
MCGNAHFSQCLGQHIHFANHEERNPIPLTIIETLAAIKAVSNLLSIFVG